MENHFNNYFINFITDTTYQLAVSNRLINPIATLQIMHAHICLKRAKEKHSAPATKKKRTRKHKRDHSSGAREAYQTHLDFRAVIFQTCKILPNQQTKPFSCSLSVRTERFTKDEWIVNESIYSTASINRHIERKREREWDSFNKTFSHFGISVDEVCYLKPLVKTYSII